MRCFKRTRGEPYNFEAYYEFQGETASRQIEIHPEAVLLLTGFSATEASLSDFDFCVGEEIDPTEFDELWDRLAQLPHGTRRADSPFLKQYLWGIPRGQ